MWGYATPPGTISPMIWYRGVQNLGGYLITVTAALLLSGPVARLRLVRQLHNAIWRATICACAVACDACVKLIIKAHAWSRPPLVNSG